MENLIYTTAVLGTLIESTADAPGHLASVMRRLNKLDAKITEMVAEEDRSGIDHTEAVEQYLVQAEELVANLRLGAKVELYFTDELAEGQNGRLRLEIPNSAWDGASPLYLL